MKAKDLRKEVSSRGVDWLAKAGDRFEKSRPEAGGRKVLCPWHDDQNASCQLTPHDDDISAHCFSCDRHGTSIDFLSACWAKGLSDTCDQLSEIIGKLPPSPALEEVRKLREVPKEELETLWASCLAPDESEPELSARGLMGASLGLVLRKLPDVCARYPWARFRRHPWGHEGHRWILRALGPGGELVTLHARSFNGADPKGLFPMGVRRASSVVANSLGESLLRGKRLDRLIICEGVPDFLSLCQVCPDVPIWGIVASGSWSDELAACVPPGCSVLIWTHSDANGAGQRYDHKITSSLDGRKVRSICIPLESGQKKAPDVNDILRKSGPAGVLAAMEAPSDGWDSILILDGKGRLAKRIANAVTIFGKHPKWQGVLAYNELSGHITKRQKPPWFEDDKPLTGDDTGKWEEDDTARAQSWLERSYDLSLGPNVVAQAVRLAAQRQGLFHPVKEYLGSLEWDGVSRLDTVFERYFGASGGHLACVGVWWFISAVARPMSPGCKVDHTIILEGDQGEGKSSGLEALVPLKEWIHISNLEIGHKDAYQVIRPVWIVVLDEISSFRGRAWEDIKQYLTAAFDSYRPSYGKGHEIVNIPRQQVFAGSTNPNGAGYIDDPTGGRRIWPVKINRVDVAGIARDRDLLWAEAMVRYRAGQRWWPDSEEERSMLTHEQEQRLVGDPIRDRIASWLGTTEAQSLAPNGLTIAQIMDGCGYPPSVQDKRLEGRAAPVLRAMGWERRVTGKERQRRWFKE